MTRYTIPDPGPPMGYPLLGILLFLLLTIAVITIFIVEGQRQKREARPPEPKIIPLRKEICPVCHGTTKMPEEVHDSDDIQFTACGRCGGSGEILTI